MLRAGHDAAIRLTCDGTRIATSPAVRLNGGKRRVKQIIEVVRRAIVEFLWLPMLVVGAFVLLAALTTMLDHSPGSWLSPARTSLSRQLFGDSKATSDLLSAIAASIITVTSITFSLLLLAVQQAASALTHEVYDQFLRRRINQVYFGSFVGLAVFSLIILASVSPPYNPVFGASTALLLTIFSLILLILLLYTTINQMRPVVVIRLIHDRVLTARERQRRWIAKTRTDALLIHPVRAEVCSDKQNGYLVSIDVESLSFEARKAGPNVEVVLAISIGDFVALHDRLAEIRADSAEAAARMAKVVERSLRIEEQRDLDTDAAYGIVVASESMQPQTMAEFTRTFAIMFDRLPEERKSQAESLILRVLSALGEHVLTVELDDGLTSLARALDADGRRDTAQRVRTAHERLGMSIGTLGSRATRVKGNA